MTYTKETSTWVDVAETHYPRLLSNEEAEHWNGRYSQNGNAWAFRCVHDRGLDEPCVACEGLSILAHVRR